MTDTGFAAGIEILRELERAIGAQTERTRIVGALRQLMAHYSNLCGVSEEVDKWGKAVADGLLAAIEVIEESAGQ